jgi:hypothetical protein
MHRRRAAHRALRVLALAAAGLLPVISLHAQAPAAAAPLAPPQALGIFALLGDSLQVVQATDAPADTRIERQTRESLAAKGMNLDNVALKRANSTATLAWPQARIEMFRAHEPLSVAQQRALADGAERAELPDWMVRSLEAQKLTHLLIITRDQGDTSIRVAGGNAIGRGKSQGVGFYIDTLYTVGNLSTGELSSGMLAGYTHLRLTLMDAESGAVLRRYDVHEAQGVAPSSRTSGLDPWTYLSTAEKVAMLREMVEQGVGRGMAEIVK